MTMIAATTIVRNDHKMTMLPWLTLVGDGGREGSGRREPDGAGTAEGVHGDMSTL